MPSRLSLVLALLSVALWFGLAFVVRIQAGAVHLLLAAGMILAVRWWALRPDSREDGPRPVRGQQAADRT